MQNQPMVGILEIRRGNDLKEFFFDLIDVFTLGQSGSVGYPENMSVNCNGWFAKGGVEDDIGCFTTHTGQGLKLLTGTRDGARVLIDNNFAGTNDMFGLITVEANRFDVLTQSFLAE